MRFNYSKLYNSENESNDWLDLFFNQNFNSRNNKANFVDNSVIVKLIDGLVSNCRL